MTSADFIEADLRGKPAPRDPTGEMLYAGQAEMSERGKFLTAAELGAIWRVMMEAWLAESGN